METSDDWKVYSERFIREHLNTKVKYPQDVVCFGEMCNATVPAKILVSVNLDCGACLIKFGFWSKFISSFERKHNCRVPVIFYVTGSGEVENKLKQFWKGAWIYDPEEKFIEENGLYDDRFQAMLVDGNNKIRLIGNPMHNENLAEVYEKVIWSYYKK